MRKPPFRPERAASLTSIDLPRRKGTEGSFFGNSGELCAGQILRIIDPFAISTNPEQFLVTSTDSPSGPDDGEEWRISGIRSVEKYGPSGEYRLEDQKVTFVVEHDPDVKAALTTLLSGRRSFGQVNPDVEKRVYESGAVALVYPCGPNSYGLLCAVPQISPDS